MLGVTRRSQFVRFLTDSEINIRRTVRGPRDNTRILEAAEKKFPEDMIVLRKYLQQENELCNLLRNKVKLTASPKGPNVEAIFRELHRRAQNAQEESELSSIIEDIRTLEEAITSHNE